MYYLFKEDITNTRIIFSSRKKLDKFMKQYGIAYYNLVGTFPDKLVYCPIEVDVDFSDWWAKNEQVYTDIVKPYDIRELKENSSELDDILYNM